MDFLLIFTCSKLFTTEIHVSSEIYRLLESPYTKYQWKKLLYEQVNSYWKNYIIEMSKLYKSIHFLNTEIYKPGKQHPLIYIKTVSTRDANRIPIKLKVVSGQYILQANRARFNQNQVDTICQLCGEEEDNMEHFLLKCTILQAVR